MRIVPGHLRAMPGIEARVGTRVAVSRLDMEAPKDLPRAAFVLLACALPIALFAIHRDLGHRGDLEFFHDWYLAFRASPAFYRHGPGINYPIAGVLLVCGPAWLLEHAIGGPLGARTFVLVFKSTLVLGEIAFVLASAWLARTLGQARPRALAIALYLVPSSWAGGAWFGQIDVFGTALLLVCAAALIRHRRDPRPRWIALGLSALTLAILVKQLTLFAVPGLALLAAMAIRRHRASLALTAVVPIGLVAADPFLVLPDGFHSHLAFVLLHGSSHGELAVASGASVWALFVRGGTLADDVRLLGVSSQVWGWALFAIALGLALRRTIVLHASDRSLVALAGLGELAMATLLTGVHERYLTHAIPLLILADDGPAWRRALGGATGILAGVFVLATIHEDAFAGSLWMLARPEPLACLALAWLASWLALPVRGEAVASPRASE